MHKKLKEEFDALERERLDLFSKLDKLDATKMNIQPDEKSWSVVQVMDHLTLAETNSLRYMKKKMSFSDSLKKADFKANFRLFLLKTAMALPIKFKAPTVVADSKNDKNYNEAKAAWEETRNSIAEFLEQFPEEHLESETFKHPTAGKLTVVQALNFMRTHVDHHLRQIDRINKVVQ